MSSPVRMGILACLGILMLAPGCWSAPGQRGVVGFRLEGESVVARIRSCSETSRISEVLLIGDEGSPTDDEPVLWSIHGAGAGFQATTFAIGSTPAGFVSGVPLAEPIVSSESYVVSVRFEESDALRLRRSFNLEELNSHFWLVPRGRYVSDRGFDAVEIDCDGV